MKDAGPPDPVKDAGPPDPMKDVGFIADAGLSNPPAEGLVITEIMPNPKRLPDYRGEWFEVYNPSSTQAYDLGGCLISDDGEDAHVIRGPLVVQPGQYLTLARRADPGFKPGYVYDYFILDDDADEVVLTCGQVVDRVAYDGAAAFPTSPGRSMSLEPGGTTVTNDLGANWCEARGERYYKRGDFGTPGEANLSCSASTN